jgi:hypothetical protein
MERAKINRSSASIWLGAAALALLLVAAPNAGAAPKGDTVFRSGTYSGKTKQETVDLDFRKIEFRLSRKGKVTLLTEPVVRREFCTSVPVFTLDGATPTKPLSRRGAFTFTNTFLGTKVDRIKARFVSETRIEGFALYNFQGQSDLCSPGSVKVQFGANRAKKKKS